MAIDWADVYGVEPIYYAKCWEHSDSYCCTMRSPYLNFRIMRNNAAGMLYLRSEWDFCIEKGKMQAGFMDLSHEINFEYSPGRIIRLVTSYCCLEGLCTYPDYRPLICRVYPFFPRVSIEKQKITGYVYGSAIDQYWDRLGIEHPCFLRRCEEKLCLEGLGRLERLLKNPALLFYFKAIEITADRLVSDLKNKQPQIFELPAAEFFKKWEMLYLSGKIFNKDGLRQDLAEADREIQRLYGPFEL